MECGSRARALRVNDFRLLQSQLACRPSKRPYLHQARTTQKRSL